MNQRVYGEQVHFEENPQQNQSMEGLIDLLQKRLDEQDPQEIYRAQKEDVANLNTAVEERDFVVK